MDRNIVSEPLCDMVIIVVVDDIEKENLEIVILSIQFPVFLSSLADSSR